MAANFKYTALNIAGMYVHFKYMALNRAGTARGAPLFSNCHRDCPRRLVMRNGV
jgi:hypothetical protein